jgi:molybdopterin-guanine dinucleotide biosynthesis protein A
MGGSLLGLVLSGGASKRMGTDKALLERHGEPQLLATFRLLASQVESCFVSMRRDQSDEPLRAGLPGICDDEEGIGAAAGLLAAHARYPDAAWLVLACDMPWLQPSTIEALISARDGRHAAIAYRSPVDGLPEPLCALWEPRALDRLSDFVRTGKSRLRDVLQADDTLLLPSPAEGVLDNINTPDELEKMKQRTAGLRP